MNGCKIDAEKGVEMLSETFTIPTLDCSLTHECKSGEISSAMNDY